MLIESRIDEKTKILIDAEAASSISKDDSALDFHPDDVFDHVVKISTVVASKLAAAVTRTAEAFPNPSKVEIRFGVKVDDSSVVSVCRSPEIAQFQITATWTP